MWWTILLWLVLHAPEIIQLVKEIWDLIHHRAVVGKYASGAVGSKAEFMQVYTAYKKSRDISGLRDLHAKWTGYVHQSVSDEKPKA